MIVELNGFTLDLRLLASRHGHWFALPITKTAGGFRAEHSSLAVELQFEPSDGQLKYSLQFQSPFRTRIRLEATLAGERDLFHLIPGNIHGDNNAAHVRPGEFPVLTDSRPADRSAAPLWEFRADRASHPVSMLCCARGAVGISINPYSTSTETDEGFIRNGVFSALPKAFGVSLGYGNSPMTFLDKGKFLPATEHLVHRASAEGTIYAFQGNGRLAAHQIIRAIYENSHDRPVHKKPYEQALRALADSFATVSWSPELQQYTNCKCEVPGDLKMKPWRAIVEIGWTGGSMMAYPFALAERIFPDLKMPKDSAEIFDEICSGFNEASGFLNDTVLNRFVTNRPVGWNESDINGWWSTFLPNALNHHCAYTNAHAAYYLLRTIWVAKKAKRATPDLWLETAINVLQTAVHLQREDGAFGYMFASEQKKVVDWEGFAGCWFAAALPYAWRLTGDERFRNSAAAALVHYRPFVINLACWGTPMDTFKSIDSEGILAFIRAARLMHEFTGEAIYLKMLEEAANYEYLWRYAFRTRPQCPPLQNSNWNSCGGSITSVSNPHMHPMGVTATSDLEYLAKVSGDAYHQQRADDGIAWLMNTMELYPNVMGYGRYGVLSERTCPSDGLLIERYSNGEPASTWWSYNAWAGACAMEAIAERILRP